MKKILGLDLGVGSIGWAYVTENETTSNLIGAGVRVVPLSVDEKDEFSSGNAISKNMKRTQKRGARRNLQRYRLRKHHLKNLFEELGILPDKALFVSMSKEGLWGLRAKAATEKLTLTELARVLFHLNQKRGFKSNRKANVDEEEGKKLSEYKEELKRNEQDLNLSGKTIGQYFYEKLKENSSYRIKSRVLPRAAYINEFDSIWIEQAKHYPLVLTEKLRIKLRDEIIFYQRRLRSQKALVSRCDFEGRIYKDDKGNVTRTGPRVAPNTSPLNQLCKIWESVNNLRIKGQFGKEVIIGLEDKKKLVERCSRSSSVSQTEIFKILNIPNNEGFQTDVLIRTKGLQGNLTYSTLKKVLDKFDFNEESLELKIAFHPFSLVDKNTGEIKEVKVLSEEIFDSPQYKLWHALYSIEDDTDLERYLIKEFSFSDEIIRELTKIDFTKPGYANKSAKAIRKILPYLMEGYNYADACLAAGFRHSGYLTKDENATRILKDKLDLLQKGALRQPVVERILNQLINIVNAILIDEKYGRPDEVRIELARELKQNIAQRKRTFKSNSDRDRENKKIAERLTSEYGFKKVPRALIEKYRLYEETEGISLYSGKRIELTKCLRGEHIDIDHIVPKSLLFDDSFQNRTLCEDWINRAKGNMTAYDFMKLQPIEGLQPFESYMEMLKKLNQRKDGLRDIKYERFITDAKGIPNDFIERQLRQTAYISTKAAELLKECVKEVHFTSGTVTDFLREKWGWNNVLKNLNWEIYSTMGMTSTNEKNHRIIEGWSKRDDHRHHAIDAIVIACTKQKYIHALNNLSQINVAVKKMNLPSIDKIIEARPFTTNEIEKVIGKVFISIKKGKRLASKSYNKSTGQTNLIPRGPLSEETVYGKIKLRDTLEVPLNSKYDINWVVADKALKKLVVDRLKAYDFDPQVAFKEPLFADADKTLQIKKVPIWHFVDEYVVKYKVETIKLKDLPFIVDAKVRQRLSDRLNEFGGNEKEAFKNIESYPVFLDDAKTIPIKSVRMKTGLSKVEAIHTTAEGRPVDFVKPGNNFVFVLFINQAGNLSFDVLSYMEAFERKRQGIELIDSYKINDENVVTIFEANQTYILNLSNEELLIIYRDKNFKELTKHIYRVQKFSKKGDGSMDIWFRHQYQTKLDDSMIARDAKIYFNFRNINSLIKANPKPVVVSLLGEIRQ